MAAYTFTYTNTTVTFTVTGLLLGDSVRFFVWLDPSPGSSLVDQEFAATGNTMTKSFSVLSAEKNYAVNVGVNEVYIGTQYFDTKSGRPDDWEWTSTIAFGAAIRIGFQEWNSFCARINAFRTYKGLLEFSFSTVTRGQAISAAIVNQAISAISTIPGHGILPSNTVSGVTVISADFFNELRTALNAVT